MQEIRHNFTVRKGSVLLQTLVMCMVLSYIAVTLTQWILSRYTSVNKTFYDTSAAGGYMEAVGRNFSTNIDNTTKTSGSTGWYTTCQTQQTNTITETGISYSETDSDPCVQITRSGTDSFGNPVVGQKYNYVITMPSMQ